MSAGLNILVAGGTQAGKTTLLNCLAAAIPRGERVVTCEEVFELKVPLPDVGRHADPPAEPRGHRRDHAARLVKEALRMRPSRIIVGEVRQEECLDLLIALNTGLPGMCTVHANSAREAVTKLCTLPLLAGENVGHAFVVPTVAACVDLVVHVGTERDGRRRVREIVAVPGRVEGDVVETADLFTTRDGRLVRADGWPPHAERFERPGYRPGQPAVAVRAGGLALMGALVGLLLRPRAAPRLAVLRPATPRLDRAARVTRRDRAADLLAAGGHRVGDAGRSGGVLRRRRCRRPGR